MASSQIMSLSRRSTTPIELYWTLNAGPDLERRLKEAGVWTEPTDVVA